MPSASCRTIVYKGLVAGGRLAELYPDLARPIPVSYALFHQRYATNTQPTWRLAQPFRSIAHNGEIDTVRGNREQVRGRADDAIGGAAGATGTARAAARRLVDAGPLLSPEGSDSQSLDEMLELLVATGWDLGSALLAALPEASSLRRSPHPHVATLRRGTAGLLAPWDGPAAIVFSDGRRVGAIMDRNGLRPAAFAVTRDRLVAVASEAGAIPLAPADTVRRGRLGPGEMLLVDPRRHAVLEDADAKAHLLRRLPIHDAPRPAHVDATPAATERTPSSLRYLAGLDSEKARLDIKTMVLEAHEPLWSMGDDTPTPGLARVDRPAADHLRQSFAQVTNPPIDPERERAVMDMRVDLGRRPALLGGPPRATRRARTLRLDRPVVADLDASASPRSRAASSGSTRPGIRWPDPADWNSPSPVWPMPPSRQPAAERSCWSSRIARSQPTDCRFHRSSPSAPSTRHSPTRAFAAGPTSSSTRPTSSTSTRSQWPSPRARRPRCRGSQSSSRSRPRARAVPRS